MLVGRKEATSQDGHMMLVREKSQMRLQPTVHILCQGNEIRNFLCQLSQSIMSRVRLRLQSLMPPHGIKQPLRSPLSASSYIPLLPIFKPKLHKIY
jgi:hypothetical protein